MGSRSGTGFTSLLGYRNGRTLPVFVDELSRKLEKKKGEGAAVDVFEFLSESYPASAQLYAGYAAHWVSRAACDDYKRREKEDLKKRIQEEGEETIDSLIGPLARDFVDEKVAEFMMKEKSPMSQNQINLTKKVAQETLVMEIREEIEGWFNE